MFYFLYNWNLMICKFVQETLIWITQVYLTFLPWDLKEWVFLNFFCYSEVNKELKFRQQMQKLDFLDKYLGGTMMQWLTSSSCSKKVLSFEHSGWLMPFRCGVCMFFLCLCAAFLPQSKYMQFRSTGYTKLLIGVSVNIW